MLHKTLYLLFILFVSKHSESYPGSDILINKSLSLDLFLKVVRIIIVISCWKASDISVNIKYYIRKCPLNDSITVIIVIVVNNK